MKTKKIKLKPRTISLICLIIFLPVLWILILRLEGEKPSIILESFSPFIGSSFDLSVSLADSKSGLKRVWIGILRKGKEVVLLDRDYPYSVTGTGKINKDSFNIKIEPEKIGITDGRAVFRMVVWDYSWRGWFHGNRTYLEKDINIDTKPPELEVLSMSHNINQGGAGLVIYRISEPCRRSGAYVGGTFFPGFSGYFKDTNLLMAFFALSHLQGPGVEIFIKAVDNAENMARAGFLHYINKRKFKNDVIKISDRFLNWKMPEFAVPAQQKSKISMLDRFLEVNRKLRKENFKIIKEIAKKSENVLYWDGAFSRLPNSARRAGFGDRREYKYKARIIDHQVHLGIDLASIAHSPVPASNRGKILFAGPLGIYGKTVIIDHGFGLMSMYSHLNGFNVKKNQLVSRDDIIGSTGTTGLAGGDHLHFGILVHNTFVNPIEWWDAAWIKNNITNKIDMIRSDRASSQ
ncbi:MAG: M23 family metallopeptidase [Deltaproteobacteria bacterium]|nr:M23 family metallopeptidase [Deltaproteobacteria bacterium]